MDSRKRIMVCTEGKSCRCDGGEKLFESFKKYVRKNDLKDVFKVRESDCLGFCKQSPAVVIKPEKVAYGEVKPEQIEQILRHHRGSGEPLEGHAINRSKKKKN